VVNSQKPGPRRWAGSKGSLFGPIVAKVACGRIFESNAGPFEHDVQSVIGNASCRWERDAPEVAPPRSHGTAHVTPSLTVARERCPLLRYAVVEEPDMPFPAKVFRVFIASPSDVSEEREIVVRAIQQWNNLNAAERQVVLLPLRWETHSAPEYGRRPQEIVNRQVVDNCDVLVGSSGRG
jgi:hypothetical protein